MYRACTKEWCGFQSLSNLFLTLHCHNIHYQVRELPKILMRYQQFASHAYCRAAEPVSKMASHQEKCVKRYSEVPSSQWLEQARNWACRKWRCGRCCISGYVLNRRRCDWRRPLHQQWRKMVSYLRWSHIPKHWQGEQTQCLYLGNRATTCTDRAPAWLSKSQCILCGVQRESAWSIFFTEATVMGD
jgi:hypothetical protein